MSRLARLGVLLVVLGLGVLHAGPASAHPSPWSTVLVSTTSTSVEIEAKIPIGEYELATGEDISATAEGVTAATGRLTRRISHDVSLDVNGTADELTVDSVHLGRVGGYPAFVVALSAPVAGDPTSLDLTWLLVAREVPNHKAYVTLERGGTRKSVAILTQAGPTAELLGSGTASGNQPSSVSLGSMISMGMHHIAGGYDHLLFLTMLLLPAPLVARRRRRHPRGSTGGGWRGLAGTGKRVALVATAFTVGHSLTLAVISLGWLHVPARPIEVMVAASIVVAGVHAVRPLMPGGEPVIAAVFGLVHGGAFATTILELGLDRGDTVRAVVGFNIGIELAQLIAIACVVPLLYLASASRDYRYLVLTVAGLGSVCAVDWIVAILRQADPVFQPAFELVSAHPLLSWAALAAICLSLYLTRWAAAANDEEPNRPQLPTETAEHVPEPVMALAREPRRTFRS